ncbi:SDR family NAD(P)-dependent oxidoreductase [Hoeflea sp. BAL378]|uniref:SDR family NAD(P)-dependent oxidoreductase n=1 Tax=Hoeflea sp. BAL378 TaxID=1547437 RepID=UPI0009E067F7|nr:SDR family NAD(P)-dependent oxidoreductase [Hoeflea sp. BAL378]
MAGKVLITGARSGIGLATLRRFATAGWTVTAAVRSKERATELEKHLAAEGLTARYAVFDLQDRAATDEALAKVISSGVPDVIVNNAAVGTFGPIELSDDASIDLTFETNLVAPLRIMRSLVPYFRERGNGVIVNVSSGLGFASDVGQGLYSASKHALEAVSEALFYELRPFNVRVAVVEPGLTATDIRDKSPVTPGYGPDSPYWAVISERAEFLGSTLYRDGWIGDAATVADTIYDAATDPRTPLFVPVGRDTRLSASLRGRDALGTYEQRSIAALRDLAAPGAAK